MSLYASDFELKLRVGCDKKYSIGNIIHMLDIYFILGLNRSNMLVPIGSG